MKKPNSGRKRTLGPDTGLYEGGIGQDYKKGDGQAIKKGGPSGKSNPNLMPISQMNDAAVDRHAGKVLGQKVPSSKAGGSQAEYEKGYGNVKTPKQANAFKTNARRLGSSDDYGSGPGSFPNASGEDAGQVPYKADVQDPNNGIAAMGGMDLKKVVADVAAAFGLDPYAGIREMPFDPAVHGGDEFIGTHNGRYPAEEDTSDGDALHYPNGDLREVPLSEPYMDPQTAYLKQIGTFPMGKALPMDPEAIMAEIAKAQAMPSNTTNTNTNMLVQSLRGLTGR